MIPKKIEKKIKEKCGLDKDAFYALMNLLEYEDTEKGKQNIHCKEVIEDYAEAINYED